ncbi:MAG: hypothetical protein ACXU8U_09865 [Asticcacaulis sp.]
MSDKPLLSRFHKICPHLWRPAGEERVHDFLDPTVLVGVRLIKKCALCGDTVKSRIS